MGVAIGISMLEMYRDQGDLSIEPLLLMLQFSLFMGLSHGIYDVIILKDERDCRPVWKALLVRTFYFIAAIHASIILCILLFQSNAEEGLVNEVSLASIKDNLMSHEVRVQVILYFFAAYHGDVLNTTARIQGLCTKLGQEFLISEEYFQELPKPIPHGYIAKKEGIFELRGKKHEILIFSLQKPLTI